MSDFIGRIPVPGITLSTGGSGISSSQVFPLTTQYPFGFSVDRPVIVHRFGSLDAKQEQRYFAGVGPRKFSFSRPNLNWSDARALKAFWELMQGPWKAFTYTVPNADGSSSSVLVTFEFTPFSFDYLRSCVQVGLNFVEVIQTAIEGPYSITGSPCVRFPSTTLSTALLSETQEIIPLIHIKVRESAVPDIYLSDRRVTIGGQLYLPRIISMGEPGSDVILSQDIKGSSDNVKFAFGNADRAMTALANDTDLKYASIDLSLYHVNSGILLQLWKGVIQSFSSDGTATFPISCSDGFFQIMNQYPERSVSRQCWKTFNDIVTTLGSANPTQNCPWATKGSGGSSTSCDYYLESANGCQSHGMSKYFGGQQADPQGTNIKDDSTGFLGFGRNKVTATSIISDTIWGLALPEIWCNSGGDPLYAFMANALMVDYRDESTFSDSLGILGAGPLGGFTTSAVVTNADGFRYVVAPMTDGYVWQGLHLNGNLTFAQPTQPGYGLRQAKGSDPANPNADFFSLGQGGGKDSNGNPIPDTYQPNNFAAGTAFCEIRVSKASAIQPSTPDQHQMVVPIDYGLSGWTWDASGNRTAVKGLINPFWIAVNMLLRATGLSGNITVPLSLTSIVVTLPASSFFGSGGSTIGTILLIAGAILLSPAALIAGLVQLIGSAFAGNAFSVPMSNAANQAELILQQNLQNWQNLDAVDQTSANKAIFENNWTVIWNAYVAACNTIFQGAPNSSDAKKALVASIGDRMAPGLVIDGISGTSSSGKYNWVAYYYTPISSSPTPGDSITTPDNNAAQKEMFVLSSLMVGDGSGAAEIAAETVTPLLGTGTETQFQFQGVVSSQKPFRDWLTEVLNCCLGFYTWEFGKLKLGCRINASAVDAYGLGNTLFQTLNLKPIQSAFEHMVLSYADVAYQYQANTAEYCDKDHAAYYGRAGSPLTTQMHSVGCSTLSQALRIAATRTREELGGITYTEWRDARIASWQTTLLGLGNEVGQVVSQTHPEIPGLHGKCNVSGATVTWASGDNWNDSVWAPESGGSPESSLLNKDALINGTQVTITGVTLSGTNVSSLTVTPGPGDGSALPFQVITMCFRIQRYTLKKDWSIQIDAQTVTPSMYDLDIGPQPVDVLPNPLPSLFTPIPLGPMWAPYQLQAQSWDALFPSEWTFDSDQSYTGLADTSVAASLTITGKLPVTEFSPTGASGPIIGTITQSTTGGSLPAVSSLIVSLCAIDANGLPSAPAAIVIIGTSGTGTDTFTLSDITWPPVAGLASYVLFISLQDDLICAQAAGALTATGGGTTYTPGSITFGAAIVRSTWALPSPYVANVRVKAKLLGHAGILGALIDHVTTNTITCADLVDTSGTPPVLVGRAFSCIGRNGSSTPWLSVTITAYVPSTGTITVSPHAVVSAQPMQSFAAGDIGIVRMMCDAPNYNNLTQITDQGWINSQSGYLGLGPGEIGDIIRVISGTSRGQLRKITGIVTASGGSVPTGFSWDLPMLLDFSSVWITEKAAWIYQSDSMAAGNADHLHAAVLSVAATNFINQSILVAGFTVDVNGIESPDGDNPIREDWIYGQGPGASAASTVPYGPNGGTVFPLWQDWLYYQAVAGMAINGTVNADSSVTVDVQVTPVVPANVFSTLIAAPQITASTPLLTGGNIPASLNLFIALVGVDSAGSFTELSNIENVSTAVTTGTNSIPLAVGNYSSATVSYLIYIGESPDILYYQSTVSAAASLTLTTIDSPTGQSYGMPDPNFDHFVLGSTAIELAGAYGGTQGSLLTVESVSFAGSVFTLGVSGATFTAHALIGRALSWASQVGSPGQVPFQNLKITENTTTTIKVSSPTAPGGWSRSGVAVIAVGDLVVVRMSGTVTGAGTVVTDPLLSMATDACKGMVLRMFFEDGSNQTSFITTNSATAFTVDAANPFSDTNPVWFWIENSSFSGLVPATPAQVSAYSASGIPLNIQINNIPGFYGIQIFAANSDGVLSFAGDSPIRDLYFAGQSAGAVTNTAVYGPNGGISFPPFGDPLYPQAVSNLSIGTQIQSDGSVLVKAQISPVVPASVLSTLSPAPIVDASFSLSTTGGTIPGGQTVIVSLAAVDSAGNFTALSNPSTVAIPSGTNTNSIGLTVDNYTSAMVSFLVYVGLIEDIQYYRYTITAASSVTLTSIATVTGNSYGMPDPNFDHFVIGTTKIALAGVPLPASAGTVPAVMVVTNYTSLGSGLFKATIAGAAFTPSTLIGRTLSFVQLVSGQSFPVDFLITANNATSITFYVQTPPGGWVGSPATLSIDDLVCVRMQPTVSGGGTVVTDALLSSLIADQFKGYVLRVLFADGSNESSFIVSNTTAGDFTVQADNPFVGANPVWFWVESGSFSAMVPTTPAQDSSYGSAGIPLSVPIDNLPGFVGVQLFAANGSGELSEAGFSPIRDILWLGAPGTGGGVTVTVTTTATIATNVSQVLVDATAGAFTITLPVPSAMLYPIALVRKDSTANVVTLQHTSGTIQGVATLALDNAVLKSVTLVMLTATASKIQSFYGTTGGSSATYTIYDPRYYSGDPTGAADATAAVASAIAAGGLFLDFNTKYSTTLQAISSPAPGFKAWGGGALVLAAAAGTSLLTITTATNINLSDIILDGNTSTGTGNPVLALTSITGGIMPNSTVTGGQGIGIAVLTSTGLRFSNCDTSGCATPAMSVDVPASVNVIFCIGMLDNYGN